MSFDPTWPPTGADLESARCRNQFNALNDQNTATNQRIDNLPPPIQGPPGVDGAPGANGADGRSLNLTGEWDGMGTYNRLDLVTYSGDIFLCNTDGTTGGTPGMDAFWTQVQVSAGGTPFPYTGDAEITGSLKAGGNAYIQAELGFGMSDLGGSGEGGFKIVPGNAGDGVIPRFAARVSGSDQYNFGIDGAGITGNMGVPSVQQGAVLIYDGMIAAYKPWNGTTEDVVIGGITLHFVNGLYAGQS